MTRTKDFTIDGATYRISSLSPRDGSWIVGQFLLTNLLFRLTSPDEAISDERIGAGLAASLSSFSEDVFGRVQAKCLAACERYENNVPMPLLMKDGSGRWAVEPLDLLDITVLLVAVLVFNLKPFFAPGAQKKMELVFPNLSAIAASTDTSSGQSSPGTGDTAK